LFSPITTPNNNYITSIINFTPVLGWFTQRGKVLDNTVDARVIYSRYQDIDSALTTMTRRHVNELRVYWVRWAHNSTSFGRYYYHLINSEGKLRFQETLVGVTENSRYNLPHQRGRSKWEETTFYSVGSFSGRATTVQETRDRGMQLILLIQLQITIMIVDTPPHFGM